MPASHVQQSSSCVLIAAAGAMQIHCDKVTTGSVRRTINCLCFSADGAWLFAGTASGDVLTINVARKAVQVSWVVVCCSGGCARPLVTGGSFVRYQQVVSCVCGWSMLCKMAAVVAVGLPNWKTGS